MKKIMACNERIISDIKEALMFEINNQLEEAEEFNDPDALDDTLLESFHLCKKLLGEDISKTDYFDRSERYLDRLMSGHGFEFIWTILYRLDSRNKKRDLKRLFKLITEHSED